MVEAAQDGEGRYEGREERWRGGLTISGGKVSAGNPGLSGLDQAFFAVAAPIFALNAACIVQPLSKQWNLSDLLGIDEPLQVQLPYFIFTYYWSP
jgi:hypothetical protein